MGSKWAHSPRLCTPNSPKVSLEKHIFDTFLTDFWSQNSPFSRHFVTVEWPKWPAMGSKWAHFTGLCTPNGLGSFLEKHAFGPFFVPKQPIFKAFWDFRRAKTGCHEPKMCQKHLFWHSMWSKIIFEKKSLFFLHPVDLLDPFWHPPWATTCSLPQPTRPRYGGLGIG